MKSRPVVRIKVLPRCSLFFPPFSSLFFLFLSHSLILVLSLVLVAFVLAVTDISRNLRYPKALNNLTRDVKCVANEGRLHGCDAFPSLVSVLEIVLFQSVNVAQISILRGVHDCSRASSIGCFLNIR